MRKPRLMTPGPAPVPEDVLLELARPVIHHRSAEAKQVIIEVVDGLKEVFQTRNDVLILTASGTGAMEAAAVNTVPPGGKALVLNAGLLRRRGGATSARPTASTPSCSRPSGASRSTRTQVAEALQQHPDTVCVMGTLSETSTGTGHPVEAIGRVVAETPAVFAVDGISGVGAMECRTDDWGDRPALRRLAEGADAAAGPGVRLGQPEGLGEDRRLRLAQLLLQPQGGPQEDGQGVRHPVHPGPHPDPGPPGRRCGGSRTRGSRTSGSGTGG